MLKKKFKEKLFFRKKTKLSESYKSNGNKCKVLFIYIVNNMVF